MKISPAILLLALAFLSGCASTRDQFYQLTADGKLPSSTKVNSTILGIGPVRLPDYIDRDELVFQSSSYRFEIPSEHRWAGSLDKSIAAVLSTNLGHRLSTSRVHTYPWDANITPSFAIPVTIRQFHAVSGGDAILEANWEVTGQKSAHGSRTFITPLSQEGYEGIVAAESGLLGQLADAIAASIKE